MSQSLQVADLRIDRIVEQEGPLRPALDVLRGLTPELLAEHRPWLRDEHALDENDTLLLAFQSFLVRTPHHTILIDTCIGNDKPRPGRPAWDMKTDSTFMDGLARVGVSLDQIDYVMCTHMHVDHVGWNTRLQDGRWVPTFPKARYVFAKTEFDYWQAENAKADNAIFQDSVLPIVEAGRAEMVTSDHGIGEHVRLLPTPGHTPGHYSVRLGQRDEAVVSGDIMHSPLQCLFPDMSAVFDVDPDQSAVSRRHFLERYADTDTVCCMTHFPSPSFGRVKRSADGFRCDMLTG